MISINKLRKIANNISIYRLLKKVRNVIIGREIDKGLIYKLFIYAIFISTAYIYLNPIFYMFVTMIKSDKDLLDPTVTWIPSSIFWGHLKYAWNALDYLHSFAISFGVSLTVAILHCISCGITGYAFSHLQVPFKKVMFFLLFLTFIMPAQVTILPTIIAYNQLGFSNSMIALIIPALFGFGVKGSLFVIIYRQFFLTQPKELEEAARVEGANVYQIFTKVMFPLARPAILVVFLFSFVWTWNDSYLPSMFMTSADSVPLASQMARLDAIIKSSLESGKAPLYFFEPIKMAASFMVILPPLLLYLFAQRWFVESVERTGLVE